MGATSLRRYTIPVRVNGQATPSAFVNAGDRSGQSHSLKGLQPAMPFLNLDFVGPLALRFLTALLVFGAFWLAGTLLRSVIVKVGTARGVDLHLIRSAPDRYPCLLPHGQLHQHRFHWQFRSSAW